MKKLQKKLEEIKTNKRLGLMTHVVIGYPSLEDTIKMVKQMEKSGVDIVELQIPFSDPLADGPTIMKACETSLKNGTRVSDAFSIMRKLAKEVSIPLLFMAYYNTVFRYSSSPSISTQGKLEARSKQNSSRFARTISGVEAFCRDAKTAGCEGLIVPDVSIEEEVNEHFIAACKKFNLANIRVVSPSSTPQRLKKNAAVGTGFVYVTARQGITGARVELDKNLIGFLKKARQYFTIPIAVGFGISKKEHIQALKENADIAIVGSAIIDVINSSKPENMEQDVSSFIRELKMIN